LWPILRYCVFVRWGTRKQKGADDCPERETLIPKTALRYSAESMLHGIAGGQF